MRQLAGYADRISAKPGDRVGFKVSCDPGVAAYRADLVRLWCLDDHRDGPGLQTEAVVAAFAGDYPGRSQPVRLGSAMEVRHPGLAGHSWFSLTLSVFPTLHSAAVQVIAATDLWQMRLVDGRLDCVTAVGRLALEDPLPLNRWTEVALTLDSEGLMLRAGGQQASALFAPDGLSEDDVLFLADAPEGGAGFFGKLARPRLWSGAECLATCDFSSRMGSITVPDRGPQAMHGRLINMPFRAVTGPDWDGSAQDWRVRPEHYDAIHFHADDLADCGWQDDFALGGSPWPAERALCRAAAYRGLGPDRIHSGLAAPCAARGAGGLSRLVCHIHGLCELPGDEPLQPLRDVSGAGAGTGARRSLPQPSPRAGR